MADLRQTRKRIQFALGVSLGIDIVAVVVLFSPLVGSTASRKQQLNQLWSELQIKTKQVAPLKDLPGKLQTARMQITEFYKRRFPAADSEINTEFAKLAAANNVTVEQARYKGGKDLEAGRLLPVEVEADLTGSYVSLAQFINALERDDMLFIINNITLAGEQKGPIKLQMKVETYLKAGGAS
jgi:Tfp pilus assembly protein PilO